jgi:hypothetical protein
MILAGIGCSNSTKWRGLLSQDAPTIDPAGEGNGSGTGGGSGGGGEGVELDLDPLLVALLKKIPSTEKGWPGPTRLRWFRTFAMNVSQIYDGDDSEPVEMKIELESKEAAH